jgi:hypothetical protein
MGQAPCHRCGATVDAPEFSCWLCGDGLCESCWRTFGHCVHDDLALDEIDYAWATAGGEKRAELIEEMKKLAARYAHRVPIVLRRPAPGKPN